MSRQLAPEAAETLKPGSEHYRAYVGPPKRYGLMTLQQMSLLGALGLEETDAVLDFGCGSLRLGRSLIPFLRPGRYYGLDPVSWLIEDGIEAETGRDLIALKEPKFSYNDDFDCTVFGSTFDFIVAQSIVTHAGTPSVKKLFKSAAASLKADGLFLLSYLKGEPSAEPPEEPWTYPFNVAYPESILKGLAEDVGLTWLELDWWHPGATWAALALDERRLPESTAGLGKNGRVAPRWRAGN